MTAPSLREPRKRFYDSLPLEGGGGAFAVSDATTEGVYPVGSPHFRAIRRLWFKIRRRDKRRDRDSADTPKGSPRLSVVASLLA